MTELVLAPRSTITVKVGEKAYAVQKPSNRQLKQFQSASKDEATALDAVVALLDSLGLPADVCWDLAPESLEQVIEALTPKKKG